MFAMKMFVTSSDKKQSVSVCEINVLEVFVVNSRRRRRT